MPVPFRDGKVIEPVLIEIPNRQRQSARTCRISGRRRERPVTLTQEDHDLIRQEIVGGVDRRQIRMAVFIEIASNQRPNGATGAWLEIGARKVPSPLPKKTMMCCRGAVGRATDTARSGIPS